MAYIGRRPDEVFRAQATHDTFTGDGSTVAFDLSFEAPDNDADLQVFVDNVRQEPGASKSYTIGADGSGDIKRITFNVAPDSSAEIYVINPGRDTSLIDVADAAVTTAKIASTAVTTAKIGADAITGAKLADDAVDSEHLVDGSVDNVHLSGSIANSKLANSSITINGTAVSLGGSVTAGTDWQAVTVADGSTQLTAVAGKGYFLDTNTGVIEVSLPTSPSRGDTIVLADYGGNFSTNNVIVDPGSNLIDSVETAGFGQGYVLSTNNLVVELVYVDSSKGWLVQENEAKSSLTAADDTNAQYVAATGGTLTTSGDFKIHTFTGDGCFVVSSAGNSGGNNQLEYLVVAGGGAGGSEDAQSVAGGGGGAGGFRFASPSIAPLTYPAKPLAGSTLTAAAQTYPVSVGGGGAGGCTTASGSNSVFSTITAAGGGGGGFTGGANPGPRNGLSGGSGGGASHGADTPEGIGGSGNTPPVSPPQGNNGGGMTNPGTYLGGGGGGATAAGTNGGNQTGPGGDGGGLPTAFGCNGAPCGSYRYYAGGGGGGGSTNRPQTGPAGTGGKGGGAAGGAGQNDAPAAATANTGGGGGGAGNRYPSGPTLTGSSGGKGVVVIRYKFQN